MKRPIQRAIIWTSEPRSIGVSTLHGKPKVEFGQPKILQVVGGPAKMRATKRQRQPTA